MPEPLEVASRVDQIDVYRSHALITRRARVEPAAAEQTLDIRIPGLPIRLCDDSVRISVVGERLARVIDVHVELRLSPRDTALRTQAAETLRALMRERVEIEVERRRVIDTLRYLEGLAPAAVAATDLPETLAFQQRHQVGAWLQLADYARAELTREKSRLREVTRKRRQLRDRINAAQADLDKESEAQAEALAVCRKAAQVKLALSGRGGPVDLEVSYLVSGCRWLPEYELRVLEERDEAELLLKALVAQESGEDWPRVALAFSTADLHRSADLPELDSWRIGKVQPPKPSGWRELPETLDELFEGYDSSVRSIAPPAMPPAPRLPQMPRLGPSSSPAQGRAQPLERLVDAIERRRDDAMLLGAMAEEPEVEYGDEEDDLEEIEAAEEMDLEEEAAVLSDAAAPMPATVAMPAGPPPPSMEAPMRRQVAQKRSLSFGRGGGAKYEKTKELDGVASEPYDTGVAASRKALTYGSLRMRPAGDDSYRGQLKAVAPAESLSDQLQELASELGVASLPPDALARLIAPAAPTLAGLALPPHAVPIESSAGHFAARYQMEGAGSVPSDGQLHALTLMRQSGGVRRVYRCVPSVETNVFQVALFDNPMATPLLAGPVRVYKGDDFVVSAPLDTTPPGKRMTANLGVEPNIKVARNTHFTESTSGLFGGGTVLQYKVEIEVCSRLQSCCRLELFERVPVSRDEDINVEVVRSQPRAERYDQSDRGRLLRGGWMFALQLDPDEKRTCLLEYEITIPSKHVLVGGNRRD